MRHQGKINATRLFQALGRIGYSPTSAILDIVDNSVSANAQNVTIKIVPERRNESQLVIEKIYIIDDGSGMNEDGLHNALSLGSDTSSYTQDTLSKFGLGLKSAAASLGMRLQILTSTGSDIILSSDLDIGNFERDEYSYEISDANDAEHEEFKKLLNKSKGTIIIISRIHTENMPSIVNIENQLESQVGIIYYYRIKDNNLNIYLNRRSRA